MSRFNAIQRSADFAGIKSPHYALNNFGTLLQEIVAYNGIVFPTDVTILAELDRLSGIISSVDWDNPPIPWFGNDSFQSLNLLGKGDVYGPDDIWTFTPDNLWTWFDPTCVSDMRNFYTHSGSLQGDIFVMGNPPTGIMACRCVFTQVDPDISQVIVSAWRITGRPTTQITNQAVDFILYPTSTLPTRTIAGSALVSPGGTAYYSSGGVLYPPAGLPGTGADRVSYLGYGSWYYRPYDPANP